MKYRVGVWSQRYCLMAAAGWAHREERAVVGQGEVESPEPLTAPHLTLVGD